MWQEGAMGSLNIWSEIREQGWTIPTPEHQGLVPVIGRLFHLCHFPFSGTTPDNAWTLNSVVLIATVCGKHKKNALYHFIFSVHLLCILALPCIINEFYILIDKVKSNEFLNYTHAPFEEMEMWARLELCECMCVYEGLSHGSYLFGWILYIKLDFVEMFSMKEDVWAGEGEILQPCQYLLKQAECEYFVLQPPSGTSFSV